MSGTATSASFLPCPLRENKYGMEGNICDVPVKRVSVSTMHFFLHGDSGRIVQELTPRCISRGKQGSGEHGCPLCSVLWRKQGNFWLYCFPKIYPGQLLTQWVLRGNTLFFSKRTIVQVGYLCSDGMNSNWVQVQQLLLCVDLPRIWKLTLPKISVLKQGLQFNWHCILSTVL